MKTMLYLYLDNKEIKLLSAKRALLGQQEVSFFSKKLEVNLLEGGKVANTDHLASAIKEGLTALGAAADRDVFLILPQESFVFLKIDVPADIASSALKSFIYDKARSTILIDIDNCFSDFYVKEIKGAKHISFFAIDHESLTKYHEAFKLLNLRLSSVLPETLAIFKLFEKTLRSEKKENILYATYDKNSVSAYLFDSAGLISDKKWVAAIKEDASIEKILKEKVDELEKEDIKLNRIILSGPQSDSVRQDTFTKNVGVWTNPLKRIVPNFYEEYVKQLVVPSKQTFPLLTFDVCFGAFVFSQENREFQMLKKPLKSFSKSGFSLPKLPITKKEILIFLLSLALSFGVFYGISNFAALSDIKLPNLLSKPSPTPTKIPATPTPAPKINKGDLRIKVLNGSGTAGKASEMKDLLTEKGYGEILTDNADNFDYTRTVIQAKKDAKAAVPVLIEDLKDSVENPKTETLDEDEAADIVIIIGTDFK